MKKHLLFAITVLFCCALTVEAQEKKKAIAYFFGQIADASSFGYKAPDGGMVAGGSYRLHDRITILGEYGYEWVEKTFLDNGHNEFGSLGARLYVIPDRLFAQVKASVVSHQNDTYTKTVVRGNLGVGVHASDFTATLSFFSPQNEVVEDPNTVRGASVTVDYERRLFDVGPVSVGSLSSGQFATATFTQTGDVGGDRFRGNLWSGRTGFVIRF